MRMKQRQQQWIGGKLSILFVAIVDDDDDDDDSACRKLDNAAVYPIYYLFISCTTVVLYSGYCIVSASKETCMHYYMNEPREGCTKFFTY
eukprot:scaffold19363_cov164-Skeletonema_marinoi.AAC.2